MSDDGAAPVPDLEDVPAELRERDQWLMWDASADAPRRPHWKGDFGVSWTDPDDWHSFEGAITSAQENDSWGIGYVFAKANDDYPRGLYGALDLDGCAEEGKGRPKEWLPSLAPFIDRGAYIEWSPSGTGLHIPLAGFEPPEWWSDSHFSGGEHEGVEAYGSKFFTVTGDRLLPNDDDEADAGDAVAVSGEWVEEWLAQAHELITGEDPRPRTHTGSAESEMGAFQASRRTGDEWIDADTAAEALEYVDPDLPNDEWVRIGFALGGHFPAGTAERLFEHWSRGGSKWNAEAERRVSSIIGDADGSVGIGTLVYQAKQGGWDASGAAREATRTQRATDGGSASTTVTDTPAQAADTDTDDDEDADRELDLDTDEEWTHVRELFRSGDAGTTGLAKQNAARLLLDEYNIITVEETKDNEKDVWRYDPDQGIYHDDGLFRIRKTLAERLGETYSRSRVNDIIHRVRSETYVKRDTLGAPEGLICLTNGVLDITDPDDPALEDHSPAYRFTWRLNAAYDPDAESSEFKPFLGGSVRPEDITKLQEYAGDALRHWKQPRNLLVILGPTDSGKGVFMRVLRAVFGGGNAASETLAELTDTRWGAVSLLNRPINLANELSTGLLERPERAKNFAGGGDTISVEDKGESKFELTPTSNHLFATNQVPQVKNADEAFYNRWLFVSFPTRVPTDQQDDELDTRMIESEEERSAILNWLLEGYARRQSRTGTAFDGERSIAEKEEMWAAYGTSVERFIANCIGTENATDEDDVVIKDAYEAYKSMCTTVGVSVESQSKLTREIKKEDGVGASKRTVDAHFDDAKRPRVYTGVVLTDTGHDHLQTAVRKHEAGDRGDTDEDQTGLDDHRTSEISQRQAISSLVSIIDELVDDADGEPVPIEQVLDAAPHTEDKARHIIGNLTEQGALLEEPEGHVRRVN